MRKYYISCFLIALLYVLINQQSFGNPVYTNSKSSELDGKISRASETTTNVHTNFEKSAADTMVYEGVAGEKVVLDASSSYDPDGDQITYHWKYDKTSSSYDQLFTLTNQTDSIIYFYIPQDIGNDTIAINLEVTDDGQPAMMSTKKLLLLNKNQRTTDSTFYDDSQAVDGDNENRGILNSDSLQQMEFMLVKSEVGKKLILDASNSYDPDGNTLYFYWWFEETLSSYPGSFSISGNTESSISFGVPIDLDRDTLFVFLEVKDNGLPVMKSYQKIAIVSKDIDHADGSESDVDDSGQECEGCENQESNPATSAYTSTEGNEKLTVFPNPARDRLNIQFDESKQLHSFKIIDISGRIMMQGDKSTLQNYLDISDFQPSTYIFLVRYEDHSFEKVVFIKR